MTVKEPQTYFIFSIGIMYLKRDVVIPLICALASVLVAMIAR